jgi:DNA mismatch endonuclease (patch repair protein)
MADIVDTATRSRMMAGIRGKNTKPEMLVRRLLHQSGFRYRLHVKDLPGTPDIVLPRYNAVIFVNGCFWHGHNCRLFKWPQTRQEFWHDKITRNHENDQKSREALLTDGWRTGVIWECMIRDNVKESWLPHLIDWILGNESFREYWI